MNKLLIQVGIAFLVTSIVASGMLAQAVGRPAADARISSPVENSAPGHCLSKLALVSLKVERYIRPFDRSQWWLAAENPDQLGTSTGSNRPSWWLTTTNPDQVATKYWIHPESAQQPLPSVGTEFSFMACPAFLKEPLTSKAWYFTSLDGSSTYKIDEIERHDTAVVYEEASMGEENKQSTLNLSDTQLHMNGFRWVGGIQFGQTRAAVELILLGQGFEKLRCRPWFDDRIKSYVDACTTYKDDKYLGAVKNYEDTGNTQQAFSAAYGLMFRSGRLARLEYEFPKSRYLHMLLMLTARYGEPISNAGDRPAWPQLGDAFEFMMVRDGNVSRPVSIITIVSDRYYGRRVSQP